MPLLSLAPIRGITDATFREVFASHFAGFDLAVAPFLTTYQGNRIKPARLAELAPEKNRRLPVIPQILAKDPDNFIALAKILCDLGYDTVNWNLGCPYPMVANKMRGSGLLPHPERIEAFLDRVHSALPVALSIKCRLGRNSPGEIFSLFPVFNRFPLREVIIHPRTGSQMYTGRVDLETFARCLAHCDHPVVYNGDIVDTATFAELSDRFPTVSGFMIGRGALMDPFLPAAVKNLPLPANRSEVLAAFHHDLFVRYLEMLSGPAHILGRMKGIWNYLAEIFVNSRKILKKIRKCQSINRYRDICQRTFGEEPLRDPGSQGELS